MAASAASLFYHGIRAVKLVKGKSDDLILNPEYILWHRQDQLLSSWLQSTLCENMHTFIVGLEISKEVWETLEINFASQTRAKVMQHKLQLQTLKKGNLSMREYLNQIKNYCDTLAAAGQYISEEDKILHILSGLGHEYNPVMIAITSKTEHCTLREVSALLLSFENRLESSNIESSFNIDGSNPSANFASQTNTSHGGFTHSNNRGQGGQNFYPNRGGRGPFRGGFRDQNNATPPPALNLMAHLSNINSNIRPLSLHGFDSSPAYSNDVCWYPDSGASNHITHDFNNLNIASDYHGAEKLQIGNRTGLSIVHYGDSFARSSQSHTHIFHLKNLLHVPSITKNLISVSQFAKDNNVYFEFHPLFCFVKDRHTWAILLRRDVKDGLYRFTLQHSLVPVLPSSSLSGSLHQHPLSRKAHSAYSITGADTGRH
ncbi:hypothetical protein C2S53_004231 [Perilla frutescens var. hirtella]|uniref:Retrovirus-related Pol polyprotein from transposon TNT 1-94-like beta-barrel domain-containing protein n=1 Tax=Perilla frutescens var. hirtella TaxID=608512 RepID=A0AAD4IY72_PERFH|nr:hypothetical protein C2S53_004231 [Perilla frutescens var. hirtella]